MDEREFNKRWERIIHQHNVEYENAHSMFFPLNQWKYNQIIGYIEISVTRTDVKFGLYKSKSNRFRVNSKTKQLIQWSEINPSGFYANKVEDECIHEMIRSRLEEIKQNNLKKTMYIDYSSFDNIFDYIDIKNIMKSL